MSLLKTVCFLSLPACYIIWPSPFDALLLLRIFSPLSLSLSGRVCVCVRARVRGQLLFTGAGKTIMEKYLWSTSVAHQQMIIKPGPVYIRSSGRRATTAPPFVILIASAAVHYTLYYITITRVCECVWVCVSVWVLCVCVCVCDCVCVDGTI